MVKRKDPDDYREKPKRRRDGRDHIVHQEIIARRMGGGAPPTPDAYARALEQWQQLPGSIVRPPTDVNPPTKEPTNSQPETGETEPTVNDSGEKEEQK